MSSQERRARHKERLRAEILNAARELSVSDGFEKISMRRIAAKIEYSPKTIYLYFRDKSEILYHLCEEAFKRLSDKLDALGSDFPNAEAALAACLRAYVEFALEDPNDYKVAMLTDAKNYPYRSAEELPADSVAASLLQRIAMVIQSGMDQGVFRRADVQLVLHAAWAGVHGLACILITDPEFHRSIDKQQLIDTTIDIIMRGLKN